MTWEPLIFAIGIGGIILGAAALWLVAAYRSRRMRTHVESLRDSLARAEFKAARVDELQQQLLEKEHALSDARAQLAAGEARLKERESAVRQQIEDLTRLRGEISKDFEKLAGEALKSQQSSFLNLANATFEKHKESAKSDLSGLIKPMSDTLKRYEDGLKSVEKARDEAYGSLKSELKNVIEAQSAVRTETSRLVNALRAAPKLRGRWGEQQLQNVMELSGMSEYVDFTTQTAIADGDNDARLIPDAIIRLPGERSIVVDAKTSMAAYLDAVDCEDDAEKDKHLLRHTKLVRTHVDQLGSKRYQDRLEVTPDFVAMFIPGENFFAAAAERDPGLLDYALDRGVLIVTPTTLMGLAKAIAYGWRQEKMADNAREVAAIGRELYKRLAATGEHIQRMGRNLANSVKGYNDMVGSLERSVMPQARRFEELEVAGQSRDMPALTVIESEPREPASGRDLNLAGQPLDKIKKTESSS